LAAGCCFVNVNNEQTQTTKGKNMSDVDQPQQKMMAERKRQKLCPEPKILMKGKLIRFMHIIKDKMWKAFSLNFQHAEGRKEQCERASAS